MCFAPYYSPSQLIEIRFILNKLARIQILEDDSILHVMKLFEQYKNYVKDNDGVDVEFPEYKIDFDSDGSNSGSNPKDKSRNKGRR